MHGGTAQNFQLAGKWFLHEDRGVLEVEQGFGGQVCAAVLRGRGCGGFGGFVWEFGNFTVFVM